MKDLKTFAAEWEAAWNSHDLDRILKHYRSDIVFRSRKAVDWAGSGEVRGIDALRAYWAAALARQPDLNFKIKNVFVGHETLVITYRNHKGVLAAETLYFDNDGLVWLASASHEEAALELKQEAEQAT